MTFTLRGNTLTPNSNLVTAMRILRLSAIITLGLALGYLVSDAAERKAAPCCEKAARQGRTCDHKCCIEAARQGRNCEKCGGRN
jgi:hypothetical protein